MEVLRGRARASPHQEVVVEAVTGFVEDTFGDNEDVLAARHGEPDAQTHDHR